MRRAAVTDAIREWPKKRLEMRTSRNAGDRERAALVIFAPVKCESYSDDNGGYRDDSRKLFRARRPQEVINVAKEELRHLRVAYVPVDSLGCVEVESVRWVPDQEPGAGAGALTRTSSSSSGPARSAGFSAPWTCSFSSSAR